MSTIQSSDEHLTLNASGSAKEIKLQANGVEKAKVTSTGIDVTGRITTDGITEDTSGKVGIGTTSPNHPLTVSNVSNNSGIRADGGSGQNNTALMLTNSSVNKGFRLNYNVTGDALIVNNTTGDGTYGGSEYMRIDSSGRVTMPYQPVFSVKLSVTPNYTTTGVIPFNSVQENVGSHYNTSNGRFTAPVTGIYHFSYDGHAEVNGSNAIVDFYKNGSVYTGAYKGTDAGDRIAHSFYMSLSQNDYVECRLIGGNIYGGGNQHSFSFCGMLVS